MPSTIADLAALLQDIPTGDWVAISERLHKVVAYGADAQTVLTQARIDGEPNPLIVRVPEQSAMFF
jgi:hypothetical protein